MIMLPHTDRWFIRRLATCLLLILMLTVSTEAADLSGVVVKSVLDGDTLVLSSSERVRLLGLNAPERGEPFSIQARERLYELTHGKKVRIKSCSEKDQYGRTLAVVRAGGINVNMKLLEEGLAVPMLIPPCGKIVARDVLRAGKVALEEGRGIYAAEDYHIVNHGEAGNHIGRQAVVRGKVLALHKGRKVWHLNFGNDWKNDFTAVLFRQGRSRFESLGIDPEKLVGREVLVIGRVKSYNGPEIVLRGPEQIIPVD